MEYTQQELIEFLQARWRDYRILVGLFDYEVLISAVLFGRGQTAYRPIHASPSVIYSQNTEEGRLELETIEELHLELQQRASYSTVGELRHRNRQFVTGQLKTILNRYPFLKQLSSQGPTRARLVRAVNRTKRNFQRALARAERSSGEERTELLGYTEVLSFSFQSFSSEQQASIESYFEWLQAQSTLWSRVTDILTSGYFWGMMGCWTMSFFVPPVALVCGAIGVGFAIPGVVSTLDQVQRVSSYHSTGAYDSETYAQTLVNAAVTGAIYNIFASSALPSFVKNIRQSQRLTRNTFRRLRLSQYRPQLIARQFARSEAGLVASYARFYIKDFGISGVSDAAFSALTDSSLDEALPDVHQTLGDQLQEMINRSYFVYLYSDHQQVMASL